MLKRLLTVVLLAVYLINVQAQQLTPPAETFRLGISGGTSSHRLAPQEKARGIAFQWGALPDTHDFILEVVVTSLQQTDTLLWSFGDCQPGIDINVFNVEGQAFTCYYGESARLRTLQAVTPIDDVRLNNGRQGRTPLLLYESGKRTGRPVLAGRYPFIADSRLYFCLYEQSARADCNYFILPDLLAKIDESKHSKR